MTSINTSFDSTLYTGYLRNNVEANNLRRSREDEARANDFFGSFIIASTSVFSLVIDSVTAPSFDIDGTDPNSVLTHAESQSGYFRSARSISEVQYLREQYKIDLEQANIQSGLFGGTGAVVGSFIEPVSFVTHTVAFLIIRGLIAAASIAVPPLGFALGAASIIIPILKAGSIASKVKASKLLGVNSAIARASGNYLVGAANVLNKSKRIASKTSRGARIATQSFEYGVSGVLGEAPLALLRYALDEQQSGMRSVGEVFITGGIGAIIGVGSGYFIAPRKLTTGGLDTTEDHGIFTSAISSKNGGRAVDYSVPTNQGGIRSTLVRPSTYTRERLDSEFTDAYNNGRLLTDDKGIGLSFTTPDGVRIQSSDFSTTGMPKIIYPFNESNALYESGLRDLQLFRTKQREGYISRQRDIYNKRSYDGYVKRIDASNQRARERDPNSIDKDILSAEDYASSDKRRGSYERSRTYKRDLLNAPNSYQKGDESALAVTLSKSNPLISVGRVNDLGDNIPITTVSLNKGSAIRLMHSQNPLLNKVLSDTGAPILVYGNLRKSLPDNFLHFKDEESLYRELANLDNAVNVDVIRGFNRFTKKDVDLNLNQRANIGKGVVITDDNGKMILTLPDFFRVSQNPTGFGLVNVGGLSLRIKVRDGKISADYPGPDGSEVNRKARRGYRINPVTNKLELDLEELSSNINFRHTDGTPASGVRVSLNLGILHPRSASDTYIKASGREIAKQVATNKVLRSVIDELASLSPLSAGARRPTITPQQGVNTLFTQYLSANGVNIGKLPDDILKLFREQEFTRLGFDEGVLFLKKILAVRADKVINANNGDLGNNILRVAESAFGYFTQFYVTSAKKINSSYGSITSKLIGNPNVITSPDAQSFLKNTLGVPNINDFLESITNFGNRTAFEVKDDYLSLIKRKRLKEETTEELSFRQRVNLAIYRDGSKADFDKATITFINRTKKDIDEMVRASDPGNTGLNKFRIENLDDIVAIMIGKGDIGERYNKQFVNGLEEYFNKQRRATHPSITTQDLKKEFNKYSQGVIDTYSGGDIMRGYLDDLATSTNPEMYTEIFLKKFPYWNIRQQASNLPSRALIYALTGAKSRASGEERIRIMLRINGVSEADLGYYTQNILSHLGSRADNHNNKVFNNQGVRTFVKLTQTLATVALLSAGPIFDIAQVLSTAVTRGGLDPIIHRTAQRFKNFFVRGRFITNARNEIDARDGSDMFGNIARSSYDGVSRSFDNITLRGTSPAYKSAQGLGDVEARNRIFAGAGNLANLLTGQILLSGVINKMIPSMIRKNILDAFRHVNEVAALNKIDPAKLLSDPDFVESLNNSAFGSGLYQHFVQSGSNIKQAYEIAQEVNNLLPKNVKLDNITVFDHVNADFLSPATRDALSRYSANLDANLKLSRSIGDLPVVLSHSPFTRALILQFIGYVFSANTQILLPSLVNPHAIVNVFASGFGAGLTLAREQYSADNKPTERARKAARRRLEDRNSVLQVVNAFSQQSQLGILAYIPNGIIQQVLSGSSRDKVNINSPGLNQLYDYTFGLFEGSGSGQGGRNFLESTYVNIQKNTANFLFRPRLLTAAIPQIDNLRRILYEGLYNLDGRYD